MKSQRNEVTEERSSLYTEKEKRVTAEQIEKLSESKTNKTKF